MLPQKLEIKNFTSYKDTIIDFTLLGDIFCVIGENGSGKSSIIDMITTALFYRARGVDNRGSGMEELINNDADFFEVNFQFEMNNESYQIIRRKFRNGAHELEFYINGANHSEKINETQEKINKIIKMDYDTFLDTICIGQGQSGRFMEKKPNERKDVFVQVLGLDKYEVLEEHTKKLRKETRDKITIVESNLDRLSSSIINKDEYTRQIDNSTIKINQYNAKLSDKEQQYENIITLKAQYEQLKEQKELILTQRKSLKAKLDNTRLYLEKENSNKLKLEDKIINKESVENKINELQKLNESNQTLINDILTNKSSLETKNNILMNQARELKSKYENLQKYNKADCDFCGQNISEAYKSDKLKELTNSGKKYLAEINRNKAVIEDLTIQLNGLRNKLNENNTSIRSLNNEYNIILQSETQLLSCNDKIVELNNLIIELENDYNENIKVKIEDIEEKTFNDHALKQEIDKLRQDINSLSSVIAVAKNQLSSIEESETEITKLSDELSILKQLYEDYDDLAIAWGKSGIQASIIDNALPEIEDEINNLLLLLCNGDVSIAFKTQKERKTKKNTTKNITSIETLDIIVNDANGSRKYETYSGGEKFRIDFACHVGLSKFLTKRAGATIDFFMIDEGIGSQDDNAKSLFVTSVYKLSKTFKQVMIITHLEDMKEAFENKVLINKDPRLGSLIKKIS